MESRDVSTGYGSDINTGLRRPPDYPTAGFVSHSHTWLASSGVPSDVASNAPTDDTSPPGSQSSRLNIDNPLEVYSPSERERKIDELISLDASLRESHSLLRRGALHATERDIRVLFREEQDGKNLSASQKKYIKEESTCGSLVQSKYLLGSLLSTCLAGIIQGWTQSAINGSNIGMTKRFNVVPNTWIFGFLNAAPFLIGGAVAPLISDPLQEHYLGRRGAIALACAVSVGATVGQAFSQSRGELIGCRILSGIMLAAKASAAPLLTAEVSPNHLRGKLLSTWQLSDAFGIFLGFAANLAVLDFKLAPNTTWRIQTVTVLIPTIALLFVVFLTPESPRFLMKRGRLSKALQTFRLLRPGPAEDIIGARDFVYAHFQLETECMLMESKLGKENSDRTLDDRIGQSTPDGDSGYTRKEPLLYHVSNTNYFQRIAYFWRVPRAGRALLCATTVMLAQQLTGVNTILFLSATVLEQQSKTSERNGAWVGFGLGLSNFIFGLPAFYYGDSIGRATLLLLGFPFMFFFMLLLAFFDTPQGGDTQGVLFGVFGLLFMIAYSPTAGTSPFAISAEVFPLIVREVGHSLAVTVNFVLLGFVLLVFPIMSEAMGGGYRRSLGLFAALNVVAFILCFLFVPETRGRTIEELQFTFDLPTRVHIRYRTLYISKWVAMRFFLPPALKLHLWSPERVRHDPRDFEHRADFFRWGREEMQNVEARAQGDTALRQHRRRLFYPWGKARVARPRHGGDRVVVRELDELRV